MKKLFSFLMLTLLMFVGIEIFDAKALSIKSQDLSYNFTPDALASLNEGGERHSAVGSSTVDSTTMLLLGSGLIGLAGFGRQRVRK